MAEWIDISVPVYGGMVHWPGDPEIQVRRLQDMTQGAPCNVTHLTLGAHTGTHMDAPLHFLRAGKSMDHLPFDAVVGPARVIQIRDRRAITATELRAHRFRRGDRILFKTANSRRSWKTKVFDEEFIAIEPEAAGFLVDKGVRTVGVDYLSVGSFPDAEACAETHRILLGAGIWIIEGLQLSRVFPGRHDLICLPLKVQGAEGAPARAILRPRK